MLKNRLVPYILVSVLIHTSLLFGMRCFLGLPDAQLESPVLIPVEVVVLGKPAIGPTPGIKASEPVLTKKQDSIVRSQLVLDMDAEGTDQDIESIADPVPIEENYQPRVKLETNDSTRVIRMASERQKFAGPSEIVLSGTPSLHFFSEDEKIYEISPCPKKNGSAPRLTTGAMPIMGSVLSTIPKGDLAASKPVNLAVQISSLHLSPVEPLLPAESVPPDISASGDLIEGSAAVRPHYSQKGEDVASEPVNLAIQMLSLHLSPVEPLLPVESVPPDISTSGDLIEGSTAVRPHYLQKGIEIVSEPVSLAVQMSSLHLATVEPSLPAGLVPLDIDTSADFVGANTAVNSHFSQVSHKAVITLADTQTGDNFVAEQYPLPKQVESEPRVMASTLQINSQPNGAQVYVDGMLSGDTPLDMELTLGKHEVRLALPNYYDWKAQIDLTKINQSIPLRLRLLPVDREAARE